MRLVLVGADYEENLGLGMIGAAAEAAGHSVHIVPFDHSGQLAAVTEAVMATEPEVVGLGMQFQHRTHDFLSLARRLRAAGCAAHVTAGGQLATLAWQEVLRPTSGLDSVVLHEGEATIVELLDALARGGELGAIPGLGLPGDGHPYRTAGRPLVRDLDALPAPMRYRRHSLHVGVPFIPIMSSRGCWGACSFCSITSFYRDARGYGGGRTFRERSPENVAAEMAVLWHAAGGPSAFCFHDDNLLRPRPADTLDRLRRIRAELDRHGVGKVGLIGKCRPDCLTVELARALAALGVVRLYVGVENTSVAGSTHLNRQRQAPHVRRALRACQEAGIFACYNLLIFEPRATLDDVRANIAFIREHGEHPVNFCRAEPYTGTPMQLELADRQALGGSYLGWDYRIEDDRTELLFRICAAAFRQRNFDALGVANRSMGLGYSMKLIEHFHDDPRGELPALARRCRTLTCSIVTETADCLDEALALAESARMQLVAGGGWQADPSDHERVERETALLGLRIAEADRAQHAELDALYGDLDAFAHAALARRPLRRLRPPHALLRRTRELALGASLAAAAAACQESGPTPTYDEAGVNGQTDATTRRDGDPVPGDWGVSDPPPWDDGFVADRLPPDAGLPPDPLPPDWAVSDPLPDDAGMADAIVVDRLPPDAALDGPLPPDPPPPDAGMSDALVDDPLPPDAGLAPDPLPPDAGASLEPARRGRPGDVIDKWRDTTPRRAARTADLPLSQPPMLRLAATGAEGGAIRVSLEGGPAAISLRWASAGAIAGEGREVRWTPTSSLDQLRVAARTKGGVAVLALRACDV